LIFVLLTKWRKTSFV